MRITENFAARVCMLIFCVFINITYTQAQSACPPCFNDQIPMGGQGVAPDGSGRRVIKVLIKYGSDSDSWSD